jgi:DNA-binding SARP family transcriptional activator
MLKPVFQQPQFRVCCLGNFRLVEAGSGTDMTPASRKARALIGYLCIVGKPVARERLASLLWGDRGDEQARASLRQAIYELRSMLAGNHLLKLERDTVAITEDVGTDMAVLLAAAQSGDLQSLGSQLSEWRGEFFEDMPSIDESFDAWLQSERLRVQENLVHAAADAARAGMARGEIDAARKIVAQLQQRDGTNEIVLRLALELDHRAGDTAALRRRYERFCELLKFQLDAAPAAKTQRLYHDLIACPSVSPSGVADKRDPAKRASKEVQPDTEDRGPTVATSPTQSRTGTAASTDRRAPKLTAAGLAVVLLAGLAGAVSIFLNKATPTSVPPLSEAAYNSANLTPERRLLAIDTQSGQSQSGIAALEKAARTAALGDLARNPNNAEALGVLAVLTPSARLREIDGLFERALRSEPDDPFLLNWHARFLMMVGRQYEALGELTRAYGRERALSIASNFVLALLWTGRPEDAREIIGLHHDGEWENTFFPLHVKYFVYRRDWLGLANFLRDPAGGISPSKSAFIRLCRETALAFVARDTGRLGQLRASWRSESSVDLDDSVQVLSALGDRDGSLAAIRSFAAAKRSTGILDDPGWEAVFGPNLISLRRDPRIASLFAQWGLLDYWRAVNHTPDFMR